MYYSKLSESLRIKMLEYPINKKIDIVMDTDAATEVDDPFAIAHMLLSPDRFNIKGIYAAPFAMNERTNDPKTGMNMSFDEIHRIISLSRISVNFDVYKGSQAFLEDVQNPLYSPAAQHLIQEAMNHNHESPLYVAAIGAITNIASAILIEPDIVNRLVVVWLAGDDFKNSPNVYNIYQDVVSAQVIFNSGVPLVHVPCNYVTSHLITTMPELRECIGGRNELSNYLVKIVGDYSTDHFAWGKQIWDIGVTGILIDENHSKSELIHSPIITNELTYSFCNQRHLIRVISSIDRNAIFKDLFHKLRMENNINCLHFDPKEAK